MKMFGQWDFWVFIGIPVIILFLGVGWGMNLIELHLQKDPNYGGDSILPIIPYAVFVGGAFIYLVRWLKKNR